MYARDAASAASGKQDGAVLEVALTLDDALLAGAEAEECVCRVRTLPDGDYAVSAADGAGWGAEQTVGLEWASAALQYATLGEGAEPHVVQLHSAPIAGSGGGEWKVQYCGAVGAVQARPVRAAELEQLMPEPVVLDTYKVRPLAAVSACRGGSRPRAACAVRHVADAGLAGLARGGGRVGGGGGRADRRARGHEDAERDEGGALGHREERPGGKFFYFSMRAFRVSLTRNAMQNVGDTLQADDLIVEFE